MSYIEKEKLIKADMDSIENRVRHAFNQGYDLGYKEGKANCSQIPTGSTTKKDLGVECISRTQAQTEIEMNASRYTIAKERGGMGQVEWSDQLIKVSDAVDIIRHLPSVTPQDPRWIPVSERTPKHGGEYLLWGKICEDDDEEYCFLGDYYEFEEKFGIEEGIYDPHTLGFIGTEIDEYYSVIAWMPLPKPYNAESEK